MELGALDVEVLRDGLAAIVPDDLNPAVVTGALGVSAVTVSPALARDNGSVWLLNPRPIRIGSVGVLRLTDSAAFGTGHHPTTAMCIDALQEALAIAVPESVLDVGTGSGVLALAALLMGVQRAVGLDIDPDALEVAATHARLNNLADRLELVPGGPDVVKGVWRLVVANILAAPLIEMAPVLVRRVGSSGRLILSGIHWTLEGDVLKAFQRLGMRHVRSEIRGGWGILVVQASW